MTEQKLFKRVYDQILDYNDDELISRCAEWGYEVSQTLEKYGRYVVQAPTEQAEQSSPFMYAVATAVMISEFAERAFNDYFCRETEIDLDLLGMSFEQVREFVDKGIKRKHLKWLEKSNIVGLQDIWATMCEWKSDTYKSLVEIYKEQGEKEPAYRIFNSLLKLYKDTDEDGNTYYRSPTSMQGVDAYQLISGGF